MREGTLERRALARLAGFEALPHEREGLLEALVEQERDRPAPRLVKLRANGAQVVDVTTGELVPEDLNARRSSAPPRETRVTTRSHAP
jgi:hypothetical protein